MAISGMRIEIDGEAFCINGRPTYEGRGAVEGLLFNLRTVNATFDDTLGKVDWFDDDGSRPENGHAGYGRWRSPASAEANTQRFIDALPEYRDHGILAINLNFQGGNPLRGKPWIAQERGSAGARPNGHRDFYHNSAFRPDGSIDEAYAQRLWSVIDACDRLGVAVILQLFYFGQDSVFESEQAVRRAADNAVDAVCRRGYGNVMIEIANEVMQGHFHHDILKPPRVVELVCQVRERAAGRHGRRLLVSTSEAAMLNPKQWTHEQIDSVFSECDLVLIHGGDNVETGRIGDASELVEKVEHIRARPWFKAKPRPIVANESHGESSFEAMVQRGISFGLHDGVLLQTMFPPRWGAWDNDIAWFFNRVCELTRPIAASVHDSS